MSSGTAAGTSRSVFREQATSIRWLQRVLDASVAIGCLYVLILEREGYLPQQYPPLMAIIAVLLPVVYQWTRAYDHLRLGGFFVEARLVFRGWAATLVLLVMVAFVTKTSEAYSRQVFVQWALLGYVAQMGVRVVMRYLLQSLQSRGWNVRTALILGTAGSAERFSAILGRNAWLGVRPLGFVQMGAKEGEHRSMGSLPLLARDKADSLIRAGEVDQVYIVLPINRTTEVDVVARELMAMHVDVHWVPDLSSFQLINHGVREIEGQPVLCLSDSPLEGGRWVAKWLLDKVLAAAFLVIASPLMIVVAIAVKASSPGPILFKQRRGGLDGHHIDVWKFRTMRVHQEEPGSVRQASRNDPRVTPVGNMLRRTSLDELPQLVNVLQGRMSIVGPRPHALEHDEFYRQRIDSYMLRHRVKPGITGWAQVNGFRGETREPRQMELRVRYDLYYINNWSIWFDLKIIALTFVRGFLHQNAF